jgi:hypothetical protein
MYRNFLIDYRIILIEEEENSQGINIKLSYYLYLTQKRETNILILLKLFII